MTLPLRVSVAPERADVAPGDALAFDVTVRNASDIVEHYGVELLGLPDGATVRTEPDVAKLRPTETGTLTVRVTWPVQPPAPAGTYVLGALVRSRYRGDVSRCVEVPVELAAVEEITVRATPEVVTGGRAGRYTVEVANGGNAPVRLGLAATDPERRVTAVFEPPTVDLPPGTAARALLTVQAPLPWNKETHRQLELTATPDAPGAAAGTATATFVQQPRFASRFAKVAGIGAAVLLLAAAVAVPALLTRGDDPQPAAAPGAPVPAGVPASGPAAAPAPSAAASPAGPAASAGAPGDPAASAPGAGPGTAPGGGSAPAPSGTGAGAPPGAGARTVDLTAGRDGVLPSDAFRDQGFFAGADPGVIAVPGCADARSAAVVTDPDGRRFLTSSTADDPAACHGVPLMIRFLPDAPAGSVQVSALRPQTLRMEVVFRDLSRRPVDGLSVPDGAQRGGIDFVRISPAAQDGAATAPVALTAIRFTPLGG